MKLTQPEWHIATILAGGSLVSSIVLIVIGDRFPGKGAVGLHITALVVSVCIGILFARKRPLGRRYMGALFTSCFWMLGWHLVSTAAGRWLGGALTGGPLDLRLNWQFRFSYLTALPLVLYAALKIVEALGSED